MSITAQSTASGGAVIPMALTFLGQERTPLLHGRYSEDVGRDLFSAAAELTLDVGWMAYDLGHHSLATRAMSRALRLSRAAPLAGCGEPSFRPRSGRPVARCAARDGPAGRSA